MSDRKTEPATKWESSSQMLPSILKLSRDGLVPLTLQSPMNRVGI